MNFHTQILEQLGDLGEVQDRPELGGWALYLGDRRFALVQAGRLYLRVAEADRFEFQRMGSMPLQPSGTYRDYYRVPDSVLAEPDTLLGWARRATGP